MRLPRPGESEPSSEATIPRQFDAHLRELRLRLGLLMTKDSVAEQIRGTSSLMESLAGPIGASTVEREAARENVEEFMSVGMEFDAGPAYGLTDFLDRLALREQGAASEAVQLMTLHSAKGLEFEAVIVIGIEEGLLPHKRSLSEPDEIEEERRLLYVGMTRARRRLFLSYCRARLLAGLPMPTQPSRFLDEIPAPLLEVVHGIGKAKTRPRLSRVHEGESVHHPRWGQGRVVAVEGRGRATMATIEFFDGIRQRVQLCHAPLERIS